MCKYLSTVTTVFYLSYIYSTVNFLCAQIHRVAFISVSEDIQYCRVKLNNVKYLIKLTTVFYLSYIYSRVNFLCAQIHRIAFISVSKDTSSTV